MIGVCRSKYGLRADGQVPIPKSRLENSVRQNDPLAMPRWGEKKPRINEPDYIPAGGGWADDSSMFGGMFG